MIQALWVMNDFISTTSVLFNADVDVIVVIGSAAINGMHYWLKFMLSISESFIMLGLCDCWLYTVGYYWTKNTQKHEMTD